MVLPKYFLLTARKILILPKSSKLGGAIAPCPPGRYGYGCGAHIIHNCLQCAVDCLPIDIECFAVKVYKYFYIYSVRVEELKSFCEFAGNNYNKVSQYGNTRFLSLGPSIERIISMFDGLRAYFLSQEKCPVMLRNIFQNLCLKLWLSFARDQVSTFQACIGQIEKGNISATEVAMTIENLLNNLKLKKQERFVTLDVKKQLEILVKSGEIAEEKFFEVVESFYDTSLQYADKWICSLGNTDKFKWILLNKTPAWKEIGDSINHEILSCVQAEETRLFDQWVLIKLIAERHVDDWNEENLPVSDRWLHIFREMCEKHLDFQDFCNVVRFILCLPGSTAPVERIFLL